MKMIKGVVNKGVLSVSTFALMLSPTVQTTFAAKYKITDKFVQIFDNIRGDLILLSTSVTGVVTVVCFLILILTKNERATQMSYDCLKRIFICYVCIISIVSLISFAKGFKF